MDKLGHKSYRLLKKIKDPNFEIDRLEFYSLSLFIGNKDFQILITDSETKQCVLLEDYVFDTSLSDEDKFGVVKFIFDDHHLLMANFWRTINFVIKNRKYSFVPEQLFRENKIYNYLRMHTSFDKESEDIMLVFHRQLGFINVFSVPKNLVKLSAAIYPDKKIEFIHQSSSLIQGMVELNQDEEKNVAIYLDRFGLHIIVVENKKLLFYNQYIIKKFEDYMRFIKMVAGELELDLNETPIKLYGYLGRNTPHIKKLKTSMSKLDLGIRPEYFNFSYVFDEILEHQYFDLFSTEPNSF